MLTPFRKRVLLLGSGQLAEQLVTALGGASTRNGRRSAAVGQGTLPRPLSAIKTGKIRLVHRPSGRLTKLVCRFDPDRIIIASPGGVERLPAEQLLDLRGRGILIEDGADVYARATGKLPIESLAPARVLFSGDFSKSRLQLVLKRVVDLLAAAAGLVLLAPLWILIPLAIRLDSPGPVYFVQERIGRFGKSFRVVKFRTMRPSEGSCSQWVRDNDRRITRVGKWLRRFRLDEIPQLLNVLFGDMSLIGPRPHPTSNHRLFVDKIPFYPMRALVRPGITGWAQVRYGYANDLDEETEKVRYDLYYIKHLSVWLDVRIALETVKTVLLGKGFDTTPAYARPASQPVTSRSPQPVASTMS